MDEGIFNRLQNCYKSSNNRVKDLLNDIDKLARVLP